MGGIELNIETNRTGYISALLAALCSGEEITLGPTDQELCAEGLQMLLNGRMDNAV